MRLTCHIPLCALDFDQASEKYQEIYSPAGLRECGSESLSRYHILLTSLERPFETDKTVFEDLAC